jgi:hypothetical protein
MLDLIPFAGAGRKMTNGDRQAEFVSPSLQYLSYRPEAGDPRGAARGRLATLLRALPAQCAGLIAIIQSVRSDHAFRWIAIIDPDDPIITEMTKPDGCRWQSSIEPSVPANQEGDDVDRKVEDGGAVRRPERATAGANRSFRRKGRPFRWVAVHNSPATTGRQHTLAAVVPPTGSFITEQAHPPHRLRLFGVWAAGLRSNFHRKPTISKPYLRLWIGYL